MLDRVHKSRDPADPRERKTAVHAFAGTEFSEADVDLSFDSPLIRWTTNYPVPHPSRPSLAQSTELHPTTGYTSASLVPSIYSAELRELTFTYLAFPGSLSVKSLTDPVEPTDRFTLVQRGENCFVLRTNENRPYTENSSIEVEEESVEATILAVPSSLPVSYAYLLSQRLAELLASSREEAGQEPEMSRSSLKWFLDFLKANSTLRCPLISLSPEGNIYATWRRNRDRLFSAHFLPSGVVRFVVFTPNPRERGAVTRLSGATTVSNLLDTVRPHAVLAWASREG